MPITASSERNDDPEFYTNYFSRCQNPPFFIITVQDILYKLFVPLSPGWPICAKLLTMEQDIRWKQRFKNFERGFILLRSALDESELESFNELELEGLIQRFEYTFELAWKTLKDYLEYAGIILEQVTPRAVIKAAFAAKIIADGQAWIDMLAHRNLMSHVYDSKNFKEATVAIKNSYLGVLEELYLFFKKNMIEP
jgi:nucleotidyltransferase substrate binding protein (TIGR01987 family)